MCGIAAAFGIDEADRVVGRMTARLAHRGPDAAGAWASPDGAIGHTRLGIIDLSAAGRQPLSDPSERYTLAFNGEVYNYLELRAELADYPFRSRTDSEVVLAAWARWGAAALDRMIGMFAFVIWDRETRTLTAVRDRLGVKPLYFASLPGGAIALASEIKALHAAGIPAESDPVAWATFLARGQHDHGTRTFWRGVSAVPAGSVLRWSAGRPIELERWYDLAARTGDAYDTRDDATVRDEYAALLEDSVRYRFRSDVPVGINLSGGLDSSLLLGLVHAIRGADSDVQVFTFATGDERYDEVPWVEAMLATTRHPLATCTLSPDDVPALARRISAAQDEPFGGLPTLAYARLFERARAAGVIVLLDGQGMDEQWAGYDYYRAPADAGIVQGAADPALLPECLAPDFAALAEPTAPPAPFPDRLRNLQYRDLVQTKLPRALRYNDRVSMAASTELREPFLDHRLIELALRQPPERKLRGDTGKAMLRDIAARLLPERVRVAPKRPVQTPQREWLRGPLAGWATSQIEHALATHPSWFAADRVRARWAAFRDGAGDNSFWVWQWISAGSSFAQESP